MEARLDTPRRFYYLPTSLQLGLTGLTLYIYNDSGTAITGSPFAASLVVLPAAISAVGVYETTEEVTFPAVGAYTLVWRNTSPAITVMQQVTVLNEPIGDFPTGLSRKFRYQTPGSVVASDVILRVYTEDHVQIGTSKTTAATSQVGVYITSAAFQLADTGVYLFLWTSATGGYTYTQIEQWLVLSSSTKRAVSIFVTDTSVDPAVPQQNIDVLVSTEAAAPVLQARTDSSGKAEFLLEDGDYVATARKAGYVYSRNNMEFTVEAFEEVEDSRFYLIATPFAASFDPDPLFDTSDTSLMTLDIADMRGQPISDVCVLVTSQYMPDTRTGNSGRTVGIFGEPQFVKTNGNGYAEMRLLRGQTVTVAIEGTTIRRTFEVPDSVTFELMDLLTGDGDPYDIISAVVQAAESGV